MNRLCPVSIPTERCPGSDSPILNFSSELPDQLYFVGVGYTPYDPYASPPLVGGTYTSADCYGVEFSVASQEIADLLAQANATICQGQNGGGGGGGGGSPVVTRVPYFNTAQVATGSCSSLSTFSYVVPAGSFVDMAYPDQAQGAEAAVNAKALAYAQQQVVHYDFCIGCTDPMNIKACAGGVYSSTNLFVMSGAAGTVNWTSSGLPAGIHLVPGTTTAITDGAGDSWVRVGANRWMNLTTGATQTGTPQGVSSGNTGTADLFGTPTQPGNFPFTVTATSANGNSSTWHGIFSVLGFANPTSLPAQYLCNGINIPLLGSGGTAPYVFSFDPIFAPPPFGVDIRNGVLIGSASVGTYTLHLIVTDSLGQGCSFPFSLTVTPSDTQPSFTTPNALPNGHATYSYFQNISVIGGCPIPNKLPPYVITLDSGSLPYTFSLAGGGASVVLMGFPGLAQMGSYGFTIRATDNAGQTVTRAFTLTIDSDASVTGSCANNPGISATGTAPQVAPVGGWRATAAAEKTQANAISNLITNLNALGCTCPPILVTVDPTGPHTTFTNTSGTCTIVMTTGGEYGPQTLLPGAVFDLYNYGHFTIAVDPSGTYTLGLGGGVSIAITY